MKTTITQTGELTVNKKVQSIVKGMFSNIAKAYKKHVAGVGYVHFIKDVRGVTLAKVYKDGGQIVISA